VGRKRWAKPNDRSFPERPKALASIKVIALRKLDMLNAAAVLTDLQVPPGNRLEALSGSRKGQCNIRINDQYPICFVWKPDGLRNCRLPLRSETRGANEKISLRDDTREI
jgi:proteic killer suppression protein